MDVKHGNYSVINCYEVLMSGENDKQFDYMCSNFYEVAHIANSHKKYEYLLSCINMAKEKLNDDLFWGCSSIVNLIVEDVHVPDSTKKLLPPLQVRSKGRPPSKRKESRVERVMKKNRKKNVKVQPKYTMEFHRNLEWINTTRFDAFKSESNLSITTDLDKQWKRGTEVHPSFTVDLHCQALPSAVLLLNHFPHRTPHVLRSKKPPLTTDLPSFPFRKHHRITPFPSLSFSYVSRWHQNSEALVCTAPTETESTSLLLPFGPSNPGDINPSRDRSLKPRLLRCYFCFQRPDFSPRSRTRRVKLRFFSLAGPGDDDLPSPFDRRMLPASLVILSIAIPLLS
ncbi:unnamed protein product [Lactuca saligna]|uniref:Uncharacterized protein n=1 Tax=Lactuca saligna TaxID=75948 RepID=A0AA35UMV8_LACSI|nr:unnamed protein product [Lactuca saligna]